MSKRALGVAGVFVLPAAVFLVFYAAAPNFGMHTLFIIISQAMIPTAIGLGMAPLMSCGMMDFSVGCRVLFGAVIGSYCTIYFGLPGFVIGCFAGAMLISLLLAMLYRFLRIPSMVVSMGLVLLTEAFAYFLSGLTGMTGIVKVDSAIYFIGSYPWNIALTVIAGIILYIIMYNTKIGCQIKAVGDNEILVKSMGVNSDKIKFLAILISGIFVGFGAILQICYAGSAQIQIGMATMQMVFKPMMGVMIGLVLLRLWNVLPVMILIGELTIAIIFNGLIALGLSDNIQNIILGAFLLIVMGVSQNATNVSELRRKHQVRKASA